MKAKRKTKNGTPVICSKINFFLTLEMVAEVLASILQCDDDLSEFPENHDDAMTLIRAQLRRYGYAAEPLNRDPDELYPEILKRCKVLFPELVMED